ncbi:endonuclease domain-containing protein [Thiomicrospira microaerophila]|nr:endonuclease domain-containing protein [Thiomicrospira microaerophila]
MRRYSTPAEATLWHYLRSRQLAGLKFRRQQPFQNYIVDFICHEIKFIIELDGGQHNQVENLTRDQKRTQVFEAQGYEIMRFWNNEVLLNTESVVEVIYQVCVKKMAG